MHLQIRLLATLLLVPLILTSCQNSGPKNTSMNLSKKIPLVDMNPDPDIVEVELIAQEGQVSYVFGKPTNVWCYNGSVPGPIIETKVGDTLIVHFKNNLPEATTIHWHGVEVPAIMDGSNISQKPIPPGGTFKYEFKLNRPAVYWYHPHFNTNEQVEKGLYGALVVRDHHLEMKLKLPENQRVVILDDVLLDEHTFQLAPAFPTTVLERASTKVNGREGNVMLVDGKVRPTHEIEIGVPYLYRFVNASNVRFMRLSVPKHRLWHIGSDLGLLEEPLPIDPIKQVETKIFTRLMKKRGHTHTPMMTSMMPETMSNFDPDDGGIILTPGERVDIIITLEGKPGETIPLEWHDYPRGRHLTNIIFPPHKKKYDFEHQHNDGMLPPENLLKFKLKKPKQMVHQQYAPPRKLVDIEPYDIENAETILVTMGHGKPDPNGDVTFWMHTAENGDPLPFPQITPKDAPTVKPGDTVIFEIHNTTGGDHNFHLHGFTFQHIDTVWIDKGRIIENGRKHVPANHLEIMDTIRIPGKLSMKTQTAKTITRVVAYIDDQGREGEIEAFGKKPGENSSGGWLYHCHILEHSKNGMMGYLQIKDD